MAFAFQGLARGKTYRSDDTAVGLCLRAGLPVDATSLTREAVQAHASNTLLRNVWDHASVCSDCCCACFRSGTLVVQSGMS
jgi:hypothetical protein